MVKTMELNRYTPDPDKFKYYIDYVSDNPEGKRTYEGYLAYRMKRMIQPDTHKTETEKRKEAIKKLKSIIRKAEIYGWTRRDISAALEDFIKFEMQEEE